MKIRLIALDMDGTTLENDHLTVSDRNLKAIRAALAKDVYVVTATGRMRYRLPEPIEAIREMRYAVTSNGAAVNDLWDKKILYARNFPLPTLLHVLDTLEGVGAYVEAYSGGKSYTSRDSDRLWQQFPFDKIHRALLMHSRILIDQSLQEYFSDQSRPVEKINLPYLPPEIRETVWKRLHTLEDVTLTTSVPNNAEINAAGVNKADGLAHLCAHLGISMQEVMAIGDGDNDLQMLQAVGLSVAPANALQTCLDIAVYHTARNDQDGVAQAIERFVL